MDGSRKRRTKDQVRKLWYASQRQLRFARWLGFPRAGSNVVEGPGLRTDSTCLIATSRVLLDSSTLISKNPLRGTVLCADFREE